MEGKSEEENRSDEIESDIKIVIVNGRRYETPSRVQGEVKENYPYSLVIIITSSKSKCIKRYSSKI